MLCGQVTTFSLSVMGLLSVDNVKTILLLYFTLFAPSGITTLSWWGFACLNDSKSYVGWSLVLLVGSPMPNRSKGRDQIKSGPLVLQVGGVLTFLSQSRREAQRPRGPIVAPEKKTTIGCWREKQGGGGITGMWPRRHATREGGRVGRTM